MPVSLKLKPHHLLWVGVMARTAWLMYCGILGYITIRLLSYLSSVFLYVTTIIFLNYTTRLYVCMWSVLFFLMVGM